MKNISEQELLGKVRNMCPRIELANVMDQYVDLFLQRT